jgi:hypothetical protein
MSSSSKSRTANAGRAQAQSKTTDDISPPTPSPSSQPGAVTSNFADDMMKRLLDSLSQRDKKYEEERVLREKEASEERKMLLSLLNETKQREESYKKDNESILKQLESLRQQNINNEYNNIKFSNSGSSAVNSKEEQKNIEISPINKPVSVKSSLPNIPFLSPENEQKLKKLAFTIRTAEFKNKMTNENTSNRINIDEELARQGQMYDSAEEQIKSQERKYKDKMVYEDESEDESCLQSYVKWLEARERLYPYETHKHQLYKRRYTLLSAWGRYSEWLRTGFYLGFPVSLYGININRWYLYQMQQAGLETKGKIVRKVSDRAVVMPAMSYDERDTRVHAASEEMDDLLPNSHLLRTLPVPLRYAPDKGVAEKVEVTTLQEYTQRMMKLKSMRARMLSACDSSPSSSSSSSDNDLDDFDCKMCGCVVRDRPHSDVCAKCETLRKNQKRKVKSENKDESVELPKLEKVDTTYNHTQEMYNKIKNIVREERDEEKFKDATQRSARVQNSESVLGRILNELFTPSARRTLDLTRLPKPTSLSDITKATAQLVLDVGKFDGDVSVAPRWLHEYCRGVYRYSFDVPNCLYVLTKCFIGEAKAWLDQMLDKVSLLDDASDSHTRSIEALLLLFKQQYMGQTQISMWKRQLAGTKLTSTAASIADLKLHYKTFVTIVNNLRLCDKYISEEEYRTMYMDSLPYTVSLYIGRDYQKFTTLDEIFQVATEAIVKQNLREKRVSDGGLASRKESLNSLYVDDEEDEITFHAMTSKRGPIDPQEQWRRLNTAKMTCFHCGRVGHTAYKCTLLAQPQTSLGAAAWAQQNVRLGSTAKYDAAKYIKAQQAAASSYSSSPATNNVSVPASAMTPGSSESRKRRLHKKGQKPTSSKSKSKETTRVVDSEVEEIESDN